jgi:hypothetical protein
MTQQPGIDSQQVHAALERFATPGLAVAVVTFPLTAQGKPLGLKFDQPKLLDVDFAELEFTRVLKPGKSD